MKKPSLAARMYYKGWNDAMKVASEIALAIDSCRGNEKLIADAIKSKMLEFDK